MKTTLVLSDVLMRRLKDLAARRGQTLSSLIDTFLRRALGDETEARRRARPHRELPAFRMGRPRVDVSDRDALEEAMEGPGRRPAARPPGRRGY